MGARASGTINVESLANGQLKSRNRQVAQARGGRRRGRHEESEAIAQDAETGEVLSDYLYLKFADAAQDCGGECVAFVRLELFR